MFFNKGIVVKSLIVDRGDPSVPDFTTFICNQQWNTLDLSSIVPANAYYLHLRVLLYHTVMPMYLYLRKKGYINWTNIATCDIFAVNTYCNFDLWVGCDNDRKIEYYTAITTWPISQLTVRGWVLH